MQTVFYVIATAYSGDDGVALAQFGPFATKEKATEAGLEWYALMSRDSHFIVFEGVAP